MRTSLKAVSVKRSRKYTSRRDMTATRAMGELERVRNRHVSAGG